MGSGSDTCTNHCPEQVLEVIPAPILVLGLAQDLEWVLEGTLTPIIVQSWFLN